LLFVKAAKSIALSIAFLPILGCALGTGILFAALVRAVSYSPDNEDILFNYAALGFAFIETFAFTLFFVAIVVYSM
jgi:F0F1-type ATP synthase membrane subunit c/vacuolar-type H+-ATPase subunit K